jgi:hypothetical protein
MNDQELLDIVHIPTGEFSCNTAGNCVYKERTLSFALGVNIPTVPEDPDEIFKECCYTHNVFADLSSGEDFRNDYSGFWHQKQLSTETADFFLYEYSSGTEYPLNNGTYGQYFGFGYYPQNVNLKGYRVDWKKVLQVRGAGAFKIIKRVVIAGVPLEFPSITFTLRPFSWKFANTTVRMDIVMNGRLERLGVDFKGTGWKHSLRVPGFFGRREPKFEEDNLIGRDYESTQVSMNQNNEYKFQTNLIPSCLTSEIIDFMLFANDIYMNDYNLNNHSYSFQKFGVKLSNNDGTRYGVKTRKASLNLVFSDKVVNAIKRNY